MAMFAAPGGHYDRFMGRYTNELAPVFADAAGIAAGMRVLDVGCGPGGLTAELARRVGEDAVAAVDPSPPFVAAAKERVPGADVRQGEAEALPFADDAFDAALASLVVAFMRDAEAGVAEMARVTRPGGTVAACMWDVAGGRMHMLRLAWQAAAAAGRPGGGESRRAGTGAGDLGGLFRGAGLEDVREGELTVRVRYADLDDLWEPMTLGIGPAGSHIATLDAETQDAARAALHELVGSPDGPFELEATAWLATGRVAG